MVLVYDGNVVSGGLSTLLGGGLFASSNFKVKDPFLTRRDEFVIESSNR